jgi:hypothetical protein
MRITTVSVDPSEVRLGAGHLGRLGTTLRVTETNAVSGSFGSKAEAYLRMTSKSI